MSQAKERPILFNGPMVRAIVNGRKTVTRRLVKAWQQPSQQEDGTWFATAQRHQRWGFGVSGADAASCAAELASSGVCPYGRPGERLWVRETFADIGCRLTYRADLNDGAHCVVKRWIPSLHMMRIDSRILLEITAVRVERLQDISKQQALAEGVRLYTDHAECGDWYHVEGIDTYSADPCKSFELLWESTGGDWATNPWVWVVEFKVIEPSPAGCDYHGSHFGASYPDAQCVDGFLWDEDSCDVPGGPLMSGGDIPCPKCNAEAYADHQREMSQ